MDLAAQAVSQIIKEQQAIVGPLALDQAKKVSGLQVADSQNIKITGKLKDVLDNLVKEYAKLFGQASVQVCQEAFKPFSDRIPDSEVPEVLRGSS